MEFDSYQANRLHLPAPTNMHGFEQKSQAALAVMESLDDKQYNPCAESFRQDGVPEGEFTRIRDWSESATYPGTSRIISIYQSPTVAESTEPPAFMFFNDGDFYCWRQGQVRATWVLDNMTAKGELPPLIAVFVNPGASEEHPDQRSIEYDTVSPRFLSFINSEIVPLVEDQTSKQLSKNPTKRLICGMSSGGICAFNAAWHGPASFGLVLSHCGSFTNIRGGHNYPSMIRRNEKKPIKVFLQSGKLDLNNPAGNWPLANKEMASALEFANYDHKFIFGEGAHTLRHGGAIFADSLRWLFKESDEKGR